MTIPTTYPVTACLHTLFERQVERTPTARAVTFEQDQMDYHTLNQRANQLAHHLRRLGVTEGTLVGLYVERSLDTVIGILGIMKAGGAYVPLDPVYPPDRLMFMIEDTQVPVVVTQSHLAANVPATRARMLCLDADGEAIAQESLRNVPGAVTPTHPAYVIYTSGSTGRPKGVVISHANVVRLFAATDAWFQFNAADVWTFFHSSAFDFSVWELWGALLYGGHLVIVPYLVSRSPDTYYRLLVQHRVTVLNQTPSAFYQLMRAEEMLGISPNLKLRYVIFGGEALHLGSLAPWFQRHGDTQPQLVNMYGITETTVHVTYRPLTRADAERADSVIGQPISDLAIYILDETQHPVPDGTPGELYVGGAGVSSGYLNRPELTRERFIDATQLPFAVDTATYPTFYRTGDLVRRLDAGDIEYLGRIDTQVKIRGFRIELGEIETVLSQHPTVAQAVVVVHEAVPDDKRLVAYVVPHTAGEGNGTSNAPETPSSHSQTYISLWHDIYEHTYEQHTATQCVTFNIAGWNSSYTGKPLPEEEMHEWVTHIVDRILALRPQQVLEIGCGTGLLLARVAPHCTAYVGLDFSRVALDNIRQMQQEVPDLAHVTLLERMADDLSDLEPASFDTVVINSVIQYFPDATYLLRVLQEAVRCVRPGGHILVGDLSNLALLETFHLSLQLHQAPNDMSMMHLKQRIQQHITEERVMWVAPAFFLTLQAHIPTITHVQVLPKHGHYHNELTCFRYDVILHIDTPVAVQEALPWRDWSTDALNLAELRRILTDTKPRTFAVRNIPNARLHTESHALQWLQTATDDTTIAQLRTFVSQQPVIGIEPEDIWALAHELPYHVELSWVNTGLAGTFDAVFTHRDAPPSPAMIHTGAILQSPSAYVNNPAQNKQLIAQWQEHLQTRLPDYMIPAVFKMMHTLPLTPNGKTDRHALAQLPVDVHTSSMGPLVAPRTALETFLIHIWSAVLGVDQVGIYHDFFALGGDSLKAMSLLNQLHQAFGRSVPLMALFDAPTVAEFATYVQANYPDAVATIAPADTAARTDRDIGDI